MKLELYKTIARIDKVVEFEDGEYVDLILKRGKEVEVDDNVYECIVGILEKYDAVFDFGFYILEGCAKGFKKDLETDDEEREICYSVYGEDVVKEALDLLEKWENEGWEVTYEVVDKD